MGAQLLLPGYCMRLGLLRKTARIAGADVAEW